MVVAAWLLASLCSLPQVQHSSDLNTLYGQKQKAGIQYRLKINKRLTILADIIYSLQVGKLRVIETHKQCAMQCVFSQIRMSESKTYYLFEVVHCL